MDNELIKITTNEQGVQCVSARELHEGLEVKSRFNDWITTRIKKYGFEENQDFILVTKKIVTNNPKNPYSVQTDYIITVDMAKELCMVENNELGRKFRRYFIECEKKLREIALNPTLAIDMTAIRKLVEDCVMTNVIQPLERTVTEECIRPLEEKVNRLECLVGIRSKTVFDYCKYIKLSLGIDKVNDDYRAIKLVLFHEFNVTKWEELNYNQEVKSRIDQLCEEYNPRRQRSLFDK